MTTLLSFMGIVAFFVDLPALGETIPVYIAAGVADSHRPAGQVAQDAFRKPVEVIALAGIKPGDRVGDFMSGGGYFTRIFSKVVGPSGRVYAYVPKEQIENCAPEETAGTRAIAADPYYTNVVMDVGPVN